jgi:2-oxoisovalerate dehydrogenase E1 component
VLKPPAAEIQEAEAGASKRQRKPEVMRKHMTRFYEEAMDAYPQLVYLGEDVRHGGYYLVSEGLAAKHPMRVMDFPPDETSLMGAGIGYSQAGLMPVVEIPYAKYLDCGADIFFEAAISNWLSAGKCPNGMLVRLQGFDKGIFGGNFHTHNSLHLPPGVDVVCYSNGRDYVRGLRYCLKQVLGGRMVMSVDSTNLLNLRHLRETERDNVWLTKYPEHLEDVLSFDTVVSYDLGEPNITWGGAIDTESEISLPPAESRRCEIDGEESAERNGPVDVAIVTFGNGVHAALLAQRELAAPSSPAAGLRVAVVDCPLLSEVPAGLAALASHCRHMVFVDVCKTATGPLDSFVAQLQGQGRLPARWRSISAPRTYNPLGNTVTFINKQDILKACQEALLSAA